MLYTLTLPDGRRETLRLHHAVQSACMRQLLVKLGSRRVGFTGELLAYLGLFRPRVQELRDSRLLALADQVLELAERHGDARVTEALSAVLDTLLPRSQEPAWQPLKNHRYLEQTLARLPISAAPTSAAPQGQRPAPAPTSKMAAGLQALSED
jgi:hypothetical protein